MAKILARRSDPQSQRNVEGGSGSRIPTKATAEITNAAPTQGSTSDADLTPAAGGEVVTASRSRDSAGVESRVGCGFGKTVAGKRKGGREVVAPATKCSTRLASLADDSAAVRLPASADQRHENGNTLVAPREGGELGGEPRKSAPAKKSKSKQKGEEANNNTGMGAATVKHSSTHEKFRGIATTSRPRLRSLRRELHKLVLAAASQAVIGGNTVTAGADMPASSPSPSPSQQEEQQRRQRQQGHDEKGKSSRNLEDRDDSTSEQVWEFLVSLAPAGASLESLFGDGITEEGLVCVTRGLGYACGRHLSGESATSRSTHATIGRVMQVRVR